MHVLSFQQPQVSSASKRHDVGHPSNMPIPPPRRKKSFNNLSNQPSNGSVDELNNIRNQVNWKPIVNANTTYVQGLSSSASDAYITEAMSQRPVADAAPIADKPIMSYGSLYNSTCQWPPIARSYNTPPVMYASASELSVPSTVASESIILSHDASNVPSESLVSESIGNSQSKVPTNTVRKRGNSLSRHRNNSLQDLRREDTRYATMAPYSYMPAPMAPLPPQGHPYSAYPYNAYNNPYVYWGNYHVPPNELDMNDETSSSESIDDDDEPRQVNTRGEHFNQTHERGQPTNKSIYQSRRSSSRNRRSSSRSRDMYHTLGTRSVSSYQLPLQGPPPPPPPAWPGYSGGHCTMMPPPPPPPHAAQYFAYQSNPYLNYYGSYVHSLASSPPGSVRSSSMVRKRSLDNFSTTSSIRASDTGHRSTTSGNHHSNGGHRASSNGRRSLDRINYQRVTNSRNGREVLTAGKTDSIRSLASSHFDDTDSDDLLDADDFYSASDDGIDGKEKNRQSRLDEKVHNDHHCERKQLRGNHGRTSNTRMNSNKSARQSNSIKGTSSSRGNFNVHRASSHEVKSTNGQVYDYDESDDNDYHHHDNDTSTNGTSITDKSVPSDKWSCKHCTFINSVTSTICEVCSKSKPQTLTQEETSQSNSSSRKSSKILSVVKEIEAKVKQETSKGNLNKSNQSKSTSSKIKSNDSAYSTDKERIQVNLTDDLIVNDELVREQIEIENELRRRRENEKRIERQNKRIEEERHRQAKENVRGENKNWTQSKLDDEEDEEVEDQKQQEYELRKKMKKNKLKEKADDEKIATGKVNKRSDDKSERKDGNSINGHVDDIYIERGDDQQEEEDDDDEEEEEEDDEDDDVYEEAIGTSEETSTKGNLGHSSIAPSVSPAEWKRLTSKKKIANKRKADCKMIGHSSSRTSGHSSRTRETIDTQKLGQTNNCRGLKLPSSASDKKIKESFSVQVRVNESEKEKATINSIISSLANQRINSSQLEKVIKSVAENLSKVNDDSMKTSSSSSSCSSSSSSSCDSGRAEKTKRTQLKEALLDKLLEEQLMNESVRANAMTRLTQKTSEPLYNPTSAYALNMIQPSNATLLSINPSAFTSSNVHTSGLSNASSVPHTAWRQQQQQQQQFAPSQQLFGDASSTLMLMASHMRGQKEACIQSSGNAFYTNFTGINPYASTGGMVDPSAAAAAATAVASSSTSSSGAALPFVTAASPALSSMSTSMASTCNPLIDNGYLVAQNIAESTSEQQGHTLNSKVSNSTSTDHGHLFHPTKMSVPSSCSSIPSTTTSAVSTLPSHTTAAIEMIKILKEAKKQGFTVDEVEIALNSHSNQPIGE